MLLNTVIYPLAFLATLTGLITWMLVSDKKGIAGFFRSLFMLGALAWLACLVIVEAEASQKLMIAARDLLSIGVVSIIMQQARSNRIAALGIFIGTAFFIRFSYLDILRHSFTTPPAGDQEDNTYPELLVEVRPGTDIADLSSLLRDLSCEIHPAFEPENPTMTELDDFYTVNVPDDQVDQIMEVLQSADEVELVEFNEKIALEPISESIESYAGPLHINDPMAGKQWALKMLNAEKLHGSLGERPSTGVVKIAILDTGVDAKHEDLQDHYVSTRKEYDVDSRGHGTHVAGIIAATTGNGVGVGSLLPPGESAVKITGIKVFNALGFATQEAVIDGMIEAVDDGAKVISMSLGGRSTDEKQRAYNEAVRYCNDKGSIVIVSAGNSNNNSIENSPANAKGVIAVSALTAKGRKAPFSSMVQDLEYGLAAPGADILSTFPGNRYKSLSGTSMAAPMVSAAVGLLLSVDPGLNTADVYELLSSSGLETDQTRKTGRAIQPAKAMAIVLDPMPTAAQ